MDPSLPRDRVADGSGLGGDSSQRVGCNHGRRGLPAPPAPPRGIGVGRDLLDGITGPRPLPAGRGATRRDAASEGQRARAAASCSRVAADAHEPLDRLWIRALAPSGPGRPRRSRSLEDTMPPRHADPYSTRPVARPGAVENGPSAGGARLTEPSPAMSVRRRSSAIVTLLSVLRGKEAHRVRPSVTTGSCADDQGRMPVAPAPVPAIESPAAIPAAVRAVTSKTAVASVTTSRWS